MAFWSWPARGGSLWFAASRNRQTRRTPRERRCSRKDRSAHPPSRSEARRILAFAAPGDALRVIQTVRVGSRKWEAMAQGAFRGIAYLETGITTERVKEDDLVVPVVQFTKPNGELTSISLDENTRVDRG